MNDLLNEANKRDNERKIGIFKHLPNVVGYLPYVITN